MIAVEKLECPFESCTAGVNGKRMVRKMEELSRFRKHLSSHLVEGFVPSQTWLNDHASRLCPGCSNAIVSRSSRCSKCTQSRANCSDVVQSMPARSLESKGLSDDSASDSSDSESSQTEYEVEEILQRRASGKVIDYLVAWKVILPNSTVGYQLRTWLEPPMRWPNFILRN